MLTGFLDDYQGARRTWRDADRAAESRGVYTAVSLTGPGREPLEVAYATADVATRTAVREIWKQRHGRAAAPLLVVVGYPRANPERALLCGPAGEDPEVVDVDHAHAERLSAAALAEPNRHHAIRFLSAALDGDPDTLPGIRNKGLLATHALKTWVPEELDWDAATERSRPLLGKRDHELIRSLGYEIEDKGNHKVLRTGAGAARAVAVFLESIEQPDEPSPRFGNQTPATAALSSADRERLRWVIAVRGGMVRLYSTDTSGAAGQRGRAETFVELNLPVLPTEEAGYLGLLFSADALADDGTLVQIREASADYTSKLSKRLRERVYTQVVPRLAIAVANQVGGTDEEALQQHYRTALTILFRLLFVAYAEDSRLLPLHISDDYTDHALKTRARRIADKINAGQDLGFDNPLTATVEPTTDPGLTDLWTDCLDLFHAVDKGAPGWGIPAYNGGLFSYDPQVNPVGHLIEDLALTNGEFGPALTALVVDRSPDGDIGPIDFRSLSVREFGTIYEGLLESELSLADRNLTLDDHDTYIPAAPDDAVVVETGDVYLHNTSGARKSSGSYFTKPFAVGHLLDHALEPTVDEHLERVLETLEQGRAGDAADRLFDFRVADIAMGSGHFLTAVVDRLEARFSTFLAEHPIPGVAKELAHLRAAAQTALGDLADTVEVETTSLLRRLIARRCVYGVDVNPISVELARVSMWIHTFVPGLPLSFLNHNLTVGNSLTGIATISEATDALTSDDDTADTLFDDPVREALAAADEPLRRLANITDATTADIDAARQAAAEARTAVAPIATLFDLAVAARAGTADMPPIVTLDDIPTGPEADNARRIAADMQALHFPIAFPEVFLRERPGFDVIVGNPPWDKVQVLTDEFWSRHIPGLQGFRSQEEKEETVAQVSAERPDLVAALEREKEHMAALQTVLGACPYDIGGGNPDLCQMFSWRSVDLARDRGRLGIVLPRGTILSGDAMQNWRREILDRAELDLTLLLNSGSWVFDIEPRYTIALTVAHLGGERQVAVRGPYRSRVLYEEGLRRDPTIIPTSEVLSYSERAAFPSIRTPDDLPVLRRLLASPKLKGHPDFTLRAIQGDINATSERQVYERTNTRPSADHIPVISGASFELWNPDFAAPYGWANRESIQSYLLGKWNRQVARSTSAYHGLGASDDPSVLPMARPRVAFRPNARSTDQRTVIACLVPGDTVLQNRAQFFYPIDASAADEAFLLGVLCTRVFDWVARMFVETTVSLALIGDLPIPRPHGVLAERVVELVGRLAAVDERFAAWASEVGVPVGSVADEERGNLLVDLEALVARLYGLDGGDLRVLYSTFHPTWDHEPFMDAVIARHAELAFDPVEPDR